MMKKLVSFMCCLLPFSMGTANAAVVTIEPGANGLFPNETKLDATTDTIVVQSNDTYSPAGMQVGTGGIDVASNMWVGKDNTSSSGGELFFAGNTNTTFNLQTGGDVSVGGTLDIAAGRNFTLSGTTNGNTNDKYNANFGTIVNNGTLTLANIIDFTVGAWTGNVLAAGTGSVANNGTQMNITADSMKMGAVSNEGGTLVLSASGDIRMSQLQNNAINNAAAGSVTVNGADINVDATVQNNAGGTMRINASGDLTAGGAIENKGALMDIDAGIISATNMTNEGGRFEINATGLNLSGGNASNPTLVSNGDFVATITGQTSLASNLYVGGTGSNFTLNTGTLSWGGTNKDILNNADNFALNVTGGALQAGTISNGSSNNAANLYLSGLTVTAASVVNNGNNLIIGKDTTLNPSSVAPTSITITGDVAGNAGTTKILSGGALTAGAVSNSAIMELNGTTVTLASVANSGTSLKITAPTDTTGKIIITGDVLNEGDGELYINARDIKIDGTVTNDIANAVTTIAGSDTAGDKLQIGQLDVNAGIVNINALAGGVIVDKTLSVAGATPDDPVGGMLNIDGATHNLTVTNAINIGGDVNIGANQVAGAGNVNIAASGPQSFVMTSTNDAITIDGNVSADASDGAARSAQFVADNITVGKDVAAGNGGKLIFGNTNASGTKLTVAGNISANGKVGVGTAESVSTVEIYADDTDAASLSGDGAFVVHGSQITTTGADSIDIANGLWFGPDSSTSNPIGAPSKGMIVRDTNTLTLAAVQGGINFGGYMLVGGGKSLTMNSAADVVIGGNVYSQGTTEITANNGKVEFAGNDTVNSGSLTITAQTIATHDITNTGKIELTAGAGITTGAISSSDDLMISAGTDVVAGAIEVTGGVADITAKTLNMALMNITGGKVNLNTAKITATTTAQSQGISVAGTLMQGGDASGMLNLTQDGTVLTANNLTVGGDFLVKSNSAIYNIENGAVNVAGDIKTDAGAGATIISKVFNATTNDNGTVTKYNIINNGSLSLTATDGANVGIIENTGMLNINGPINATQYIVNTGTTTLFGGGMYLTGALTTTGTLYQMYNGASLSAGDINVQSDEYTFATSNLTVTNIEQKSGSMVVNTSDVTVGGDINAVDLRFVLANNPADNWMNVGVTGSVSGGVQFIGLEHMEIGGNYLFNNNSALNVAILPYAAGSGTTTANYWSTVSLNDDNTLGQITNAADGAAMIQVGGKFQSNLSLPVDSSNGGSLKNGQIGLTLRDTVDQGTAIWLVHADNGLEELGDKIRNLYVNFCNADGSMCIDYLDALENTNGADGDLPAYVSVRDSDGDGNPDSLYIVFDPRFGGPVEVFKIQPIVEREADHTKGEYVSAGALDDLIAGQLQKTGFYNRTPIEVIPVMFRGTNMEQMAKELYDRMEYYNLQRDGKGLARFSRLFQVRELEQIAGAVSLNEHTNFRSFEDRMFDEFIWNRNRNLKKAWADVDFGMFSQDVSDGKTVDGNRFNISGGFDWQESQTLILGLTGRVSHMSSENSDSMDLGYRPGEYIAGHVKTKVADTNIGLGGYLMKTLGDKTRLYGNAFLDLHWFDVSRDQNYVASIDGDGTAFSLISEWGLLHDWLNQYIVGNAYARIGYNTGFSITEKASGDDYMKLESDGYMILTPGYSLTAQKRIYPSAWFQIRPYASIGIEYDVLGAPDAVKYKFAPAHSFTDYDIEIDPLWANIGGGVELLSATGIQVGLDYRYQYNADIQLHNIKISGSYRF